MNTVLIVDDDPLARDSLRLMLERAGYQVVEATDGLEAMKLFKGSPADLVVTDIFMPEMDGIEIIRELRILSPEVKIIAVSGGGLISEKEMLKIASGFGVDATFSKPFDSQEFLDTVATIIAAV